MTAAKSEVLTGQFLTEGGALDLEGLRGELERSGRKLICLLEYGSHLFGTNTASSDRDLKGVFIPSLEDYLMEQAPKTLQFSTGAKRAKNKAGDLDIELYSLNAFVKLLVSGQTIPIDMAFAPTYLTPPDPIWRDIQANRAKFLQRNMSPFLRYCSKQAGVYGVKGARLEALGLARDFLLSIEDRSSKLKEHWDRLPLGEHLSQERLPSKFGEQNFWVVVGRKFTDENRVSYVLAALEQIASNYGDRAKKARAQGNLDWKALSHAFRVADELIELLKTGEIRFPLAHAEEIKAIKEGQLPYDVVVQRLGERLEQVEAETEVSRLPEEVDLDFWNDWLLRTLRTSLQAKPR